MKLLTNAPNFSIVLPGPCNAACEFCFTKGLRQKLPAEGMMGYLLRLDRTLRSLGKEFFQISITGGEPTLSPYLVPVLSVIGGYRKRFTNVVLTTNGTRLEGLTGVLKGTVDHVNISRHHYDDDLNAQVFRGSYDVRSGKIAECVDQLNAVGIDVSVNCVIDDTTNLPFLMSFVDYARFTGFHAVRFRKINGDNEPAPAEVALDALQRYPVLAAGSCPVCKTRKRVIRGLEVLFKTSVIEPTEVAGDSIYELIFLPDGAAYSDWAGLHPAELQSSEKQPRERPAKKEEDYSCHAVSYGCH